MKDLYTCPVISGSLSSGYIIGEAVIYLLRESQVPIHWVTLIGEDGLSGPTLGLVLLEPHFGLFGLDLDLDLMITLTDLLVFGDNLVFGSSWF